MAKKQKSILPTASIIYTFYIESQDEKSLLKLLSRNKTEYHQFILYNNKNQQKKKSKPWKKPEFFYYFPRLYNLFNNLHAKKNSHMIKTYRQSITPLKLLLSNQAVS